MQYHSYHYQTETHKCYGSVSQAVSAKPVGGAGNVHLAGGFSEERVRNKYRERERKRKIDRTKTI